MFLLSPLPNIILHANTAGFDFSDSRRVTQEEIVLMRILSITLYFRTECCLGKIVSGSNNFDRIRE